MHADAFTSHLEMSYRLSVGIILGLCGVVIFATAGRFGRTVDIFLRMRVNDVLRLRLLAAAEARDRADRQYTTPFGRAVGVLAILCAVFAFFPGIAMIVPYAAFVVGGGCISLVAFMRSKAQSPKRTALLEVRQPWSSIPVPMIIVSAFAAATPLALLGFPPLRWSVIGACFGSLLLVYVGVRMAAVPARLIGQDLAAEHFVDSYVRKYRAQSMISMGSGLAMVMLILGVIEPGVVVIPMQRFVFTLIELVPVGVMVIWSLRIVHLMYAEPKPDDIEELEAS